MMITWLLLLIKNWNLFKLGFRESWAQTAWRIYCLFGMRCVSIGLHLTSHYWLQFLLSYLNLPPWCFIFGFSIKYEVLSLLALIRFLSTTFRPILPTGAPIDFFGLLSVLRNCLALSVSFSRPSEPNLPDLLPLSFWISSWSAWSSSTILILCYILIFSLSLVNFTLFVWYIC